MIRLSSIAEALKLHPRTVLRHMEDESNPYWTEDHNPELNLLEIAEIFGCSHEFLIRILKCRDDAFKEKEAAKFLSISPRVFRRRGYTPVIRKSRIVRYSRMDLANEHYATRD